MLIHVIKKCGKTRRIWKAKPYLGASADDRVKVRMKGQASKNQVMLLYPTFPPGYRRTYAKEKIETLATEKSFSPPPLLVILANKPCERNACACEVANGTERIHRGPGDADSEQHRDFPHKLRVTIDDYSGAIFVLAFMRVHHMHFNKPKNIVTLKHYFIYRYI